jgi:hypothetical protein
VAPEASETGIYQSFFNLPASADRFRNSAAISEIWPPELKERTLPYFLWEGTLSTLGTNFESGALFPDFQKLHLLSTTTPLRTPVSWMLGSNRDDLRALEQADPEIQKSPQAQFHRGAQALANRDYPRACEHFLRTVGVPEMRRIDLAACLYALCRAGRKEEADQLLSRLWDGTRMNAIPRGYWTWMKTTFDLKIPREAGTPK